MVVLARFKFHLGFARHFASQATASRLVRKSAHLNKGRTATCIFDQSVVRYLFASVSILLSATRLFCKPHKTTVCMIESVYWERNVD